MTLPPGAGGSANGWVCGGGRSGLLGGRGGGLRGRDRGQEQGQEYGGLPGEFALGGENASLRG